ncbi:hypothetical protein [Rhodopirellula baltica]
MSTPQSDLWNAYLEAEHRGLRSERNDALERYLESFAELPVASQHEWSLELASDIVDDGASTLVRMPLFRRAILPALEAAIATRTPGAARWLAGFAQHIYKCGDLKPRLIDGSLTEHTLLLTAIEHDANDSTARRKLLDLLVRRLDYTLHELPSGVLYGHDGATVDQCREMLGELDDFTHHAQILDVTDDYFDLVAKCRFHYNTYAEYLTDRRGASCYADYLSQVSDA